MSQTVGSIITFAYKGAVMTGKVVAVGEKYVHIEAFNQVFSIPKRDVVASGWDVWFKDEPADPKPQEEKKEEQPEVTPEEVEHEKLKKFFFGEQPELPNLAKQWKSEGRCPLCGEEGRIHLSTFICSKHGAY